MNAQELIAALQKQDPASPAQDALTRIAEEANRAARDFLLTAPGMRAMYDQLLEHAKVHTDALGQGNAPEDCPLHAFNGTRTMVHMALQEMHPPPEPHPADGGNAELHHVRQKLHGIELWERTDAAVAAAGLTAKGLVS